MRSLQNIHKMELYHKKLLVEQLSAHVTEKRLEKMTHILALRTRHLTMVMEDIYQSQNASAVLRSCECFGVQDVHIIENRNTYEINPDVALGSSKWLSLFKYNQKDFNTTACLAGLKSQGYRIVATSPHKDDCLLEELPVDRKTALVFGTELDGLTDEAMSMSDGFVRIPMHGFTESFNISVSAAICLYHLAPRIRNTVSNWELTKEEKTEVMIGWLLQSVRNPENLLNHYKKELGIKKSTV